MSACLGTLHMLPRNLVEKEKVGWWEGEDEEEEREEGTLLCRHCLCTLSTFFTPLFTTITLENKERQIPLGRVGVQYIQIVSLQCSVPTQKGRRRRKTISEKVRMEGWAGYSPDVQSHTISRYQKLADVQQLLVAVATTPLLLLLPSDSSGLLLYMYLLYAISISCAQTRRGGLCGGDKIHTCSSSVRTTTTYSTKNTNVRALPK